MRNKFWLIIWLLFINSLAWCFEDVDFDHSSGIDLMQQYSAKYAEPNAENKLKLLRDNYERLKPSKSPSNSSPIIPKVIHQLWISNSPIPQNFKYYLETWKENHPDWIIKVWTEQDIIKENFPSMDLYWLARSYAERSDIARYEILYRYGGLYIDTDIECFANFDDLHHKYDFYTNFEPPAINKKRVSILNAMIGSVPKHPILKQTLFQIRENWVSIEKLFEKEYSTSKSTFARSNHHLAVQRTMYAFADSVFHFLKEEEQSKHKSIILPSGYNVPVYFVNNIPIINFLSKLFRDKAKLTNRIKMQPETMSIHFYGKDNSLMNEDYFANSLFKHSEFKGMTYGIVNLRDMYYLTFRKIFQLNFPTQLEYQTYPVIPRLIYLEKDDKNSDNLVKQWKKLNPKFTIQEIDTKNLLQYLPAKFTSLDQNLIKLLGRFYLLNKTGGVYVDKGFKPANLKEFNHKYGYYGKLNQLNKLTDKLSLDSAIVAAVKDHSIMHNLTNYLDSLDAKDINDNVIKESYLDFTYKYHQLDGKSIVFPETYFNQKR
jgi:hypothetical protein